MATQADPSTDPNANIFQNALGQTSSGATPVGGLGPPASSYVPQSGGVQTSERSLWDTLSGQDNTKVNPALQGVLSDPGDQNAVNQAMAEYQAKHDAWMKQMTDAQNLVHDPSRWDEMRRTLQYLSTQEPQKPDLLAIQNQSDRTRLLTQGTASYQPLINVLQNAAVGQGPSQALNQYQIASLDAAQKARDAAEDASRRTMGDAASFGGTGGQRAAIYQAALGKAAEQRQAALAQAATQRMQAAQQAGAIGATEQQNARSSLMQALAGQTNVYGTQLYGGTQHQQDMNQNAENQAIELNARIQSQNAANASDFAKTVAKTGAEAAAAA